MATKSFTRNIRISKSESIEKIHFAMKANEVASFVTSIKDIDAIKNRSRSKLASNLTKKY